VGQPNSCQGPARAASSVLHQDGHQVVNEFFPEVSDIASWQHHTDRQRDGRPIRASEGRLRSRALAAHGTRRRSCWRLCSGTYCTDPRLLLERDRWVGIMGICQFGLNLKDPQKFSSLQERGIRTLHLFHGVAVRPKIQGYLSPTAHTTKTFPNNRGIHGPVSSYVFFFSFIYIYAYFRTSTS
jgi:hypothetical protein